MSYRDEVINHPAMLQVEFEGGRERRREVVDYAFEGRWEAVKEIVAQEALLQEAAGNQGRADTLWELWSIGDEAHVARDKAVA